MVKPGKNILLTLIICGILIPAANTLAGSGDMTVSGDLAVGGSLTVGNVVINPSPKNILSVSKDGNGNYATITAALASITDNDVNHHYLIKVAPGDYIEQVVMKPYVDIAGSGMTNTVIRYLGSTSESDATVKGASNAELRDLKVLANSLILLPKFYCTAIRNENASTWITNVAILASGSTQASYGIRNVDHADAIMRNVAITVSGGGYSYGAYSEDYSDVTITGSTITANGTGYNYGMYTDDLCETTMTDAKLFSTGGSTRNYAVYNNHCSATLIRVTAIASGSNSYGVYNRLHQTSGGIVLADVTTTNHMWMQPEYGVYNTLGASVRILKSIVVGSVNAVYNNQDVSGTYGLSSARIADSMLYNAVAGGEFTCVGCYDGEFGSLGIHCE